MRGERPPKRIIAATIAAISLTMVALLLIMLGARGPGGGAGGTGLDYPPLEDALSGAPRSLTVETPMLSSGRIPEEYTCYGGARPPTVAIRGVPGEARSVAIIMYDPDAPHGIFIHWLAYVNTTGNTTVTLKPGLGVEGRNSAGKPGYYPPCPPAGKPHRYILVAVALDRSPGLPPGYGASDLLARIRGHALAWGYAWGTYGRG